MYTLSMSRTSKPLSFCAAIGLAAVAGPAMAQDSVSTGSGLPGDAPGQFVIGANSQQVNNYVVDLAPKLSSWSRNYRVGPVAKSSNVGNAYFNHLIAAQAASNAFASGVPFARSLYLAWAVAGQGVNGFQNAPPADDGTGRYGLINTTGRTGTRFAIAFAEFGGGPNQNFGDADDEQGLIAAVINVDPADPARLFVSRINAAVNKPSGFAGNTATATFGLGGVDTDGTLHALADGYACTSGSAVTDKRFFRIAPLLRNPLSLNQINNAGGTDATSGVYRTVGSSQVTLTTPALVPAGVAGRPVLIAGDFLSNLISEQVVGTISTSTGHLPAGDTSRGGVSYTRLVFASLAQSSGNAGTCATLSRDADQARTRGISLWGTSTTGTIQQAQRIELPADAGQITDPTDGFDPGLAAGLSTLPLHEFANYAAQVSFRGGNGPVAIGVLPGGDLVAAATVAGTGVASSTPASMDNYIAVARINAASGTVTWTIAAHTGGVAAGSGKIILGDFGADGIPGNGDPGEGDGVVDRGPDSFVGRIVHASEVTPGATTGPSISSPAMDAFGNLYFLATVSLKKPGGNKLTTALLKANFDPATSRYELEELAEIGDVVAGLNSARNYQVQLLGAADSNSADSGSIWSSSIVQDVLPGTDPASIVYGDPRALGALVLRARILYDRNADGTFADPSIPANAGSPDQSYNVALVIMPGPPPMPTDPADFNGDGVVNSDDLSDFITGYFDVPPDPRCDFNADGSINADDLADFITAFFSR